MNPSPEPLAIDLLLTADERRTITVDDHQAARQAIDHSLRCMATDTAGRDEIDRELDEMIEVDPYNREPSSRKSDKELGRLLSILDNLPRGKDDE